MKIDLATIDQMQFSVKGDDRVLITPRHNKHRWTDDEVWLRSVVTDAEGNVLSMGFPKFLNLHERRDYHLNALATANTVFATAKLDGSLIIVSYIDGKPYFRTRGSLELGEFEERVMRIVRRDYADSLLREEFANLSENVSYLFEYVSPENQIVVQYQEDNLVFLGAIIYWDEERFDGPVIGNTPDFMTKMADTYGFQIPSVWGEGAAEVSEVMVKVPKMGQESNQEGIVVNTIGPGGQVLFKVKAEWYLMLHALRFQMTPKKLAMLLTLHHDTIRDFDGLKDYLFSLGYDFEIADVLETESHAYFMRVHNARNWAHEFETWVLPLITTRGDYVRWIRQQIDISGAPDWIFHYAMADLDLRDNLENYWLAAAADVPVRTVASWMDNKDETVQALIKTPKDFSEDDV